MSETDQQPVFNDRYEVHSRIGRGGMADVFLARDRLLDRPVAVKVLFPEYATDPSFVERFRREAQSAANLTHPNIVGVYDWGRQGSTYFIVMEYVNGRSLADILRADGVILPQRAADIAFDVAGALGFAHASHVVHRDVKPGNILVNPAGAVKVADFGIARALNSAHEQDLTQAGAVMGTATYFSPEQAQGSTPDPRSDLYSLGIVMYEMVAGQPPFTGDNPVAIAYKQVHEMPRRLRDVAPSVPADYDSIVMKLLAKSPADRYANGDELRLDLKRFRDGQPIAAAARAAVVADRTIVNSPITPARGTEIVRPAAATVVQPKQGAAVVIPTRVVSNDPMIAQQQRPLSNRPAPTGPAFEDEPKRTGWYIASGILVLAIAGLAAWFLFHKDPKVVDTAGTVPVPNLIGVKKELGDQLLKDANLIGEPSEQFSETYLQGVIWDQDPKPPLTAKRGDVIKYTWNPGPRNKALENLVGSSLDVAKAKLTALGLPVEVVEVESAETPGTVLTQNPAPGNVPAGTKVKLTVATAVKQIPIPNLTGSDRDAAVSKLTLLGLKPKVVDTPSDTVEKGKVIATDPAADTGVPKDTEVKILLSSGLGDTVVPKLTGLTQDEALAKIQEAGFFVGPVSRTDVLAGSPEDGKVISQNPPEGTKAAKKSAIAVVIGRGVAPTTVPTTAAPTTLPPTTLPPTTTTIAPAPSFTIAVSVKETGKPDSTYANSMKAVASGSYTWRITITNTGNTTLTDITAPSSMPATDGCSKTAFTLAAGAKNEYTCSSTILPTATYPIDNKVTANPGGSSNGPTPAAKSDTATITA